MPAVYEGAVQDLIDEPGEFGTRRPLSAWPSMCSPPTRPPSASSRPAPSGQVRFCEPAARRGPAGHICAILAAISAQRVICVVEEPKDVVAIERTRSRTLPRARRH